MPYHGEVVEPVMRFVSYGQEWAIADEVLMREGNDAIIKHLTAELEVRARAEVSKIDPYAPLIVTIDFVREVLPIQPYRHRFIGRATVEVQRYVYDDSKRLADEYRRDIQHRKLPLLR